MLENWLGAKSYRVIQLKKIAKQTGLTYSPKDEFGLINLLKDFRLFQIGGEKRIVNILRDKRALYESDFLIFDYQYTILDMEAEQNFHQTVFLYNQRN